MEIRENELYQNINDYDENNIPEDCFCPITGEIMRDPVMATDGHTYERAAIQEWINKGHRKSPKAGNPLLHTVLTPNHTLRSLIEVLKEKIPQLNMQRELDERSILVAIQLREEEILSEKNRLSNLLDQEKQKNIQLEKDLGEKNSMPLQDREYQDKIRELETVLQNRGNQENRIKELEEQLRNRENYEPRIRVAEEVPQNREGQEGIGARELDGLLQQVQRPERERIQGYLAYGKTIATAVATVVSVSMFQLYSVYSSNAAYQKCLEETLLGRYRC